MRMNIKIKMEELLKELNSNELLNAVKSSDFLKNKKEEQKKKECKNTWKWVVGIILGVAAIAGIAYALYCYFTPDYLEDFEDDMEEDLKDEFDDDFFEDEVEAPKE